MIRMKTVIGFISVYLPLVLSNSEYSNNTTPTTTLKYHEANSEIVLRADDFRERVYLEDYPHFVSVKKPIGNKRYISICGGALIRKHQILTAAHCMVTSGNSCDKACKRRKILNFMRLYVVAGTIESRESAFKNDNEGTEQWRRLSKATIPQNYWFRKNDIFVGVTKSPFVITLYVKPVPIETTYAEHHEYTFQYPKIHIKRRYVYWMGKFDGADEVRPILLCTVEKLLSTESCSQIPEENMHDFLCSEPEYTYIQEGYSGGLLMSDGVLVGIASFSEIYETYSGKQITLNFFTRLSSYNRFIRENEATLPIPSFYVILLPLIIT